jgi:RNA recognition motif-containing protein
MQSGSCRLYIGNLAENTTEDMLREFFSECGEIKEIQRPREEYNLKPQSFAFVEFVDLVGRDAALKLNNGQLNGRTIQVCISQNKSKTFASSSGTRLFVGGLAYDMTEDRLREVFQVHGSIKDVYIPKDNSTGRNRGFAFVEFYDASAAEDALQLDGTDLNGRSIRVKPSEKRERKPRKNCSSPKSVNSDAWNNSPEPISSETYYDHSSQSTVVTHYPTDSYNYSRFWIPAHENPVWSGRFNWVLNDSGKREYAFAAFINGEESLRQRFSLDTLKELDILGEVPYHEKEYGMSSLEIACNTEPRLFCLIKEFKQSKECSRWNGFKTKLEANKGAFFVKVN